MVTLYDISREVNRAGVLVGAKQPLQAIPILERAVALLKSEHKGRSRGKSVLMPALSHLLWCYHSVNRHRDAVRVGDEAIALACEMGSVTPQNRAVLYHLTGKSLVFLGYETKDPSLWDRAETLLEPLTQSSGIGPVLTEAQESLRILQGFRRDDVKTGCTFMLPFAIRIPDGEYSVSTSCGDALVSTHLLTVTDSPVQGTFVVINDRWGVRHRTEATVCWHGLTDLEERIGDSWATHERSIEAINLLIGYYRYATGEVLPARLASPDIHQSECWNEVGGVRIRTVKCLFPSSGATPIRVTVPFDPHISGQEAEIFTQLVKEQKDLEVFKLMRLEAERYTLEGDFRSAIVAVNIALESLVEFVLRDERTKARAEESEYQSFISGVSPCKQITECAEAPRLKPVPQTIHAKAKFLARTLGLPVKRVRELVAAANQDRNSIVHGRQVRATREQAIHALRAYDELSELFGNANPRSLLREDVLNTVE